MGREQLKLVSEETSQGVGKSGGQRPHKPHHLGSRVFKPKGSEWYAIDLRWQGRGRPLLRDPDDPGWPSAGVTTRSKKQAEQWAKAYDARWRVEEEEAEQHRTGHYRSVRLAKAAFLKHRQAQYAPSTASGSRTAVTHLEELVGEEYDPSAITETQLQALCDDFLNVGYKSRTVSNILHHLIAFFNFAGVDPNPAKAVKVRPQEESEVVAWNEAELQRLRDAADTIDGEPRRKGPSRRLLVEHLLGHGTRIQETAAACWEDSDPLTKTARITKQMDRRSNKPTSTKGKRARTAAVMPEWWKFHQDQATGLIFAKADGRPIRYRELYDYVREVLERAGLKRIGEAAHKFRHTYAYWFLKRGGSMTSLQKSLGHKRVSTTHRYYDHFSPDEAAEAAVLQIYGRKKSIRRGPRG